MFQQLLGIEINTGARWWEPSCVSLGWKSGTICNLVCIFLKNSLQIHQNKKLLLLKLLRESLFSKLGLFLWSDCWFCFQIKYSFQHFQRRVSLVNSFFFFFALHGETGQRLQQIDDQKLFPMFPNVKHNPCHRWTNGTWTSMLGKQYNDYGNDVCAVWLKHVIQNCQILFYLIFWIFFLQNETKCFLV